MKNMLILNRHHITSANDPFTKRCSPDPLAKKNLHPAKNTRVQNVQTPNHSRFKLFRLYWQRLGAGKESCWTGCLNSRGSFPKTNLTTDNFTFYLAESSKDHPHQFNSPRGTTKKVWTEAHRIQLVINSICLRASALEFTSCSYNGDTNNTCEEEWGGTHSYPRATTSLC